MMPRDRIQIIAGQRIEGDVIRFNFTQFITDISNNDISAIIIVLLPSLPTTPRRDGAADFQNMIEIWASAGNLHITQTNWN